MTTLRTLHKLKKNPVSVTPVLKAADASLIKSLPPLLKKPQQQEVIPLELVEELPYQLIPNLSGRYRSIDYRRTHVDPLGQATFSYIDPTIKNSNHNIIWYLTPAQYIEYFETTFGKIKLPDTHIDFVPLTNPYQETNFLAYERAWQAYEYWKKSLSTPSITPITTLNEFTTSTRTYADQIRYAESFEQSFFDEKLRGKSDWTFRQRQTRESVCKLLSSVVSSNQHKMSKTYTSFDLQWPALNFTEYFQRLIKPCSYEIMIFSIIYIHIALKKLHDSYNAKNSHLLLAAAVNIAIKMHECEEYNQAKQARHYGITCEKLNTIELKMFSLLDNNAHISREIFLVCEKIILDEIANQYKALVNGSLHKAEEQGPKIIMRGPKKAFSFPDDLQPIEKVTNYFSAACKLTMPG